MDDIDVDANFIQDNYRGTFHGRVNDEYFDVNKFNDSFGNHFNKDLKTIHLNIRSLPKKVILL